MIKNKRKIKINPAVQIVMGFAAIILIGSFLLCLPISSSQGVWQNFIDSLFTSTSAVCVTGLIVVDTSVYYSLFGEIVIMILIQIGGLGFITLTSLIFLLLRKRLSYKNRVALQESLNKDEIQGVVKLIRNVIILVFSVEFIGFICLAPSMVSVYGWGNGIFKALFLSISAFCNSGFDVLGTTTSQFQSLSTFAQNSLILLPIMFLIVVGGIGYIVMFDIGAKAFKRKKISFHSKLVLWITFILVFGGAIVFAILEWNNPLTIGGMSVWDKIVNSFFQSITPRTAGFATFDMASLTPASRILTNILMLIGGSPVSTAGGMKTTTLFILLVAIFKSTNSKGDVVIWKKQVSNRVIRKCIRVVLMYVVLMIVSIFLICIGEGNSVTVEAVVFEVISALSTVGVTMGITPTLGILSKFVLILAMFVGRVGALTLTVAIAGRERTVNEEIEYPDAKVIVG